MSKALIVSIDGHVAAPLETYRPYLEERYRSAFDESVAASAATTVDFLR